MSTSSRLSRRAALLAACLFLVVRPASADDVTVMTSGTFTAAYLELLPQLERIVKGKVVTAATSMGTGSDSIPSRLERGEAVDVVIVADAALGQLIKDGRVLAGSRVALARSGIGMAVRAGTPKPDISSLDALRRTLLQAKSIAYSASVSGRYFTTELVQRLGIADQVLGKSRRIDRERVGAVVARGEAEIGFQQISELLPVPGIEVVGPLPAPLRRQGWSPCRLDDLEAGLPPRYAAELSASWEQWLWVMRCRRLRPLETRAKTRNPRPQASSPSRCPRIAAGATRSPARR
jgi:molybdate transport system substrate-binding protein